MQAVPVFKLIPTQKIKRPTTYVTALLNEFKSWAFDQDQGETLKGQWRSTVFKVSDSTPIDLEIGTGNGFFFSHYAESNPTRCLVGMEITYKTLIQTIRRAVRKSLKNMRVIRFHASQLNKIFSEQELNNVFIYFPDPWPKTKHAKNRLLQVQFLKTLFELQRPGTVVELKTDSVEYFDWVIQNIQMTDYKIVRQTKDLHNSDWAVESFQTHFEKLWTSKGLKTNYVRFTKI